MSHIAESRKNIPFPGEIIYYILASSEAAFIPRDEKILQRIVRELQAEARFSEILAPFIFSKKVDPYPYSRLLHESLHNLYHGNLIAPDPFDKDQLTINPHGQQIYLRRLESKLGEYLPTAKLLAQALAEKLQTS